MVYRSNHPSIEKQRGDVCLSINNASYYASWIVKLFEHFSTVKELIMSGFESYSILKAIKLFQEVLERVENSYHW